MIFIKNDMIFIKNDFLLTLMIYIFTMIINIIKNTFHMKIEEDMFNQSNQENYLYDSSVDIVFNDSSIKNLFKVLYERESIHLYVYESENRSLYIHNLNENDALHYGLFLKTDKWHVINKIIKYKDDIWFEAPFLSVITSVYLERKFNQLIQCYIYNSNVIDYFNRIKKSSNNHIYLKTGIWNITDNNFTNYKKSLNYYFILCKTNYDIKPFSFKKTPVFKKILTTWFDTFDIKDKTLEVFLSALSLIYYNKFIETKSILIVQGISGAGKSLLSKLIQGLIGIESIACTNVSSLTKNQFSKSMLADKKGIILNDVNEVISLEAQEILKGLSGSDLYNYELKFQNERKLIIWNGFIIIISNHNVEFSEHVGDLPDRKLVFNFNKKLDLKEFEENQPVLSIKVSELSNGKTFYDFTGELAKEIPYIAGLLISNFEEKKNKLIIKTYKDFLIKFKINDNNILENFLSNYLVYEKDSNIPFGNAKPSFSFSEDILNFEQKTTDENSTLEEQKKIGLYSFYCIHCKNQNVQKLITRNKFKDLIKTFISQNKEYNKMRITRDERGFFTLKNANYKNIKDLIKEISDISYNEFMLTEEKELKDHTLNKEKIKAKKELKTLMHNRKTIIENIEKIKKGELIVEKEEDILECEKEQEALSTVITSLKIKYSIKDIDLEFDI